MRPTIGSSREAVGRRRSLQSRGGRRPDRNSANGYSFDRPDFDSREFNSTLVLRWEYRPGSLLYVVWSQARSDDALQPEQLVPGRGLRQVFDAPAHNVFLVKFSKWFSL